MTKTTLIPMMQVAQLTGLSTHTLRYYEKLGLLASIERANGGSRRYTEEDVAWIQFLMRLRNTGMSIKTVKTFVDLIRANPLDVSERIPILKNHREELASRIAELKNDLKVIDLKIEHYEELKSSKTSDHSCIFWQQSLQRKLKKPPKNRVQRSKEK